MQMGSVKLTSLLMEAQTVLNKHCLVCTKQNSQIIKVNNITLL